MAMKELFRPLFNWLTRYMLSTGLMLADLGKGDSPPPPDYTPVAQASEAAARISAEQADRVLAESKRQYDRNMEIAQPVMDEQLGLMKQTKTQGDEYYNYWKNNAQPVEGALKDEAMLAGSEGRQQEAVDRAVADSQGGYTRALNQGIRQGRRYGLEPIAATGAMTVQQAANTAGMATSARDKEKLIGTAKKLDVAGLYRGMPGASQGAYSLANQSGNSAVNNSLGVGAGMMAGTGAAAGLTMQGQGMRLNGLTSIAGMQNQNYNTAMQNDSSGLGGILGVAKMGLDIYTGGVTAGLWGGKKQ